MLQTKLQVLCCMIIIVLFVSPFVVVYLGDIKTAKAPQN